MNKLLISSLLILAGCSGSSSSSSESYEDSIYNSTFEAIATRDTSTKPWVGVQGTMSLHIKNTEGSPAGTFSIEYMSYKEPQFVFNSCSGGAKGNFNLISEEFTNNNVAPSLDDEGEPFSVTQMYLQITATNFSSECRAESSRNITISQYSDETIIVKSEYREIRMKRVIEVDDVLQPYDPGSCITSSSSATYSGCCSGKGGIKFVNGCMVFSSQSRLTCGDNSVSPSCVRK